MVRDFRERLVRLAFPLRSSALDSLVDTDDERDELRALQRITTPDADTDLAAYVRRPFAFPTASRFSDGTYGVLYAANSLATAVRETAYHLAITYADGNAPAMETRRAHLSLLLHAQVEDIRHLVDPTIAPAIYDPVDYRASQKFGLDARTHAQAIHYDSVRNPHGGRCAGAFTPDIVSHARIAGETALVWDGHRFAEEHTIATL